MRLLDFIFRPKKRSLRQAHEESASAIEAFVDGRGGPWDWDDYESVPEDDPFLESIRLRCCQVPADHPPKEKGHFCSPTGIEVLRSLAREIREHMKTIPEAPIQPQQTTTGSSAPDRV
jgi:hypothetical protein